MRQQGSHGYACAVALCCGLWLTGCASLADISTLAEQDSELAALAVELEQAQWTLDANWSCDTQGRLPLETRGSAER